MSKTFEMVPFHQHEILTVSADGDVLVPIKPMVEQMGVAWNGQFERINRHPVLSKGIRVTRIPSPGGTQEMTCLTLNMVPGFLVTIQSERIKDVAVREAVVLFQAEAFDVLFGHFFGGKRGAPAAEIGDRAARRRDLPGLMDKLRQIDHGETRRVLHALVVRACEAEGIDAPALESFVPAPMDDQEANAALTIIDALVAGGVVRNWHRRADMIAVRRKNAEAHGVVFTDALRRHPRFVAEKSVNPKHSAGVYCWVFRRAG